MISCWQDSIGDILENEGVAPGRIWEHCGRLPALSDDGLILGWNVARIYKDGTAVLFKR